MPGIFFLYIFDIPDTLAASFDAALDMLSTDVMRTQAMRGQPLFLKKRK